MLCPWWKSAWLFDRHLRHVALDVFKHGGLGTSSLHFRGSSVVIDCLDLAHVALVWDWIVHGLVVVLLCWIAIYRVDGHALNALVFMVVWVWDVLDTLS